jgi:4-hydroxy-3-methylbut-2-en-1-yl diphosphate reductase
MSTQLLVAAPLTIEATMLRGLRPDADVVCTGMGPRRSEGAARALAAAAERPHGFAVAGLCAAVSPDLRPGDVVLADELRRDGRRIELPRVELLERELRRRGLRVRRGPIECVGRILGQQERAALRPSGAIAVDMESAWLMELMSGLPAAVLRIVVEPESRGLVSPWTALDGLRGLRSLRQAAGGLACWGRALGPRTVLLAGPRSFCAGVDRAIEIVERALELREPPIYVRKQIVHNVHVVSELERRGAVFVEELDEVPAGATLVFSAHGVSPAVRAEAVARSLDVIDATCPLVAKVHAEARRFASRGDAVVLIGHDGHEEVEGTLGEAPEAIRLVERPQDVGRLDLPDPARVSYLTQTTLAVDETEHVVAALRERYPKLNGPPGDDICYATHNRQEALREVARESELVLVVGSTTSSNSKRLVEVAERTGTPARLIDDERDLRLEWLAGAQVVGVTAGASAPEQLVTRVVDALSELGSVTLDDRILTRETTRFKLPREVR